MSRLTLEHDDQTPEENWEIDLSRAERFAIFRELQGDQHLERSGSFEETEPSGDGPRKYFDFSEHGTDGKIYGIDVSHHKKRIDWQRVAQAGARFAYCKSTQGMTVTDSRFAYNIENATRNGIPAGAYHFLSSISPAPEQADHFISVFGPWHRQNSLPPVLDLEWDYNSQNYDRWKNMSASQIVDMCLTWLQKVQAGFGQVPLIYTNKYWWDDLLKAEGNRLQSYPIWMSRYGRFSDPEPPMMSGDFNWMIWQFTEHGTIDGVSMRGKVDINWCKPEFLTTQPAPPEPSCNLSRFKQNHDPLSEEELKSLFVGLRSTLGRFNEEQVEFLNVLVETASPADLRSFLSGSHDPPLDDEENDAFLAKAGQLFGTSDAELDVLKSLAEVAQPAAVRSCIL